MPDQDNSTRLDDRDGQGSGLLRSVEPAAGARYSMSASDADSSDKTSGSDSNKDILGGGDADSSDTDGSDADGTDGDGTDTTDGDSGGGGDADGTDFGADSDSSDKTADADGTDG
jgi:hypothetical protein